MRRVYLIGSLRNPVLGEVGNRLRAEGHEVFDDWYSAGPIADESWQAHQKSKGIGYREALRGPAARHIFAFDTHWLSWADTVVLVMPAAKSGHMEFGWAVRGGAEGYILLPEGEPDRWDIMYCFATDVVYNLEALSACLSERVVRRP